jgi:hypothetical protein
LIGGPDAGLPATPAKRRFKRPDVATALPEHDHEAVGRLDLLDQLDPKVA